MWRRLSKVFTDCATCTVSTGGIQLEKAFSSAHITSGLGRSWLHTSCAQTEGRHHGISSAAAHAAKHGQQRGAVRWLFLAAGSAALAGYAATNEDVRLAYLIPSRLARDVVTAAAIVYDYKTSLKPELVGEEREAVLRGCHQRGADRLLQLCFANGGVYTKLGQHVGQLDHLLPEEYVLTMRNNLLDRCPVTPIGEVRRIIAHDLGAPPEVLFRHFNPNPIASASLAQVHVAEDHDGRKLAVKVQHSGLLQSSAADIATVEGLVHAVKWIFPEFDYKWLVDEIKHNLPRELDFTHEAANAERCRANFASKRSRVGRRVHIPWIDHDRTSRRVLTMEFIDGVTVTDHGGLSRIGVRPTVLSRLISEAFNEMIFTHGDVHADPHAANLLVRAHPAGGPQLVLLDHGLYRVIDDKFRLEYAGLWHSLVFADEEGIKKHSEAMNAGDMYPLFAAMLTQKPWEQIVDSDPDHLMIQVHQSKAHREAVQSYAQQYAREISLMLVRIPRELLLLLKTNDCLRAVDAALGVPVNNYVVTARECTRALAEQRLQRAGRGLRWLTRLLVSWEVARLEARMAALRTLMWLGSLSQGRSGAAAAV